MEIFEIEFAEGKQPRRVIRLAHDDYSQQEFIDLFADILLEARAGNRDRMQFPEECQDWEFQFVADYLVKNLGFILVQDEAS